MTIKQLTHNIITFCNNYINNKNIVFGITKYPKYIDVRLSVWTLNNNGYINTHINTITKDIHNENDFNDFKNKVINGLPELLEKVKSY